MAESQGLKLHHHFTYMCMVSHVRLFATLWTVARQTPHWLCLFFFFWLCLKEFQFLGGEEEHNGTAQGFMVPYLRSYRWFFSTFPLPEVAIWPNLMQERNSENHREQMEYLFLPFRSEISRLWGLWIFSFTRQCQIFPKVLMQIYIINRYMQELYFIP